MSARARAIRTVDRAGNQKTATYTAGRLTSIVEVGIDGTTTRTWALSWTGSDLTRLARPDGTALEFFYTDAAHPGFMTHYELVGTLRIPTIPTTRSDAKRPVA